jgi:S-adenosylmethionine synthetase
MESRIIIGELQDDTVEMAECKGIGHPDTICDAITEQVSIELCKYYLDHFGAVLHHNVDKALLIGGQSKPGFEGGKIIKPISLIITGRATSQAKGHRIPVAEIAVKTAEDWLRRHIRHLGVPEDIKVTARIRPGSAELVELFQRFAKGEVPFANDTSFGVGYYPPSPLENIVLQAEAILNAPETKEQYPFIGEDIKVMGTREEDCMDLTVAIAMVDRYISGIEDYVAKIKSVKAFMAEALKLPVGNIQINTADNYEKKSIYLTVTGTSAEHGDDGQVGRGNRINGLITPYRPMSLEAASGKNPVSHTGKIYNYLSRDLSRAIVENQLADQARVFILSQIGRAIDQPRLLHIQLLNRNAPDKAIREVVRETLAGLPQYWKRMVFKKTGASSG